MRILYVGDAWEGATAVHRALALLELGHDLVCIDSTQPGNGLAGTLRRAMRRLGGEWDFRGVNRTVRGHLNQRRYDVLWVDKGLAVRPETLAWARESHPDLLLVSYHPDDIENPRARSVWYLASIPLYDLHVTHRRPNVEDLYRRGARDVVRIDFSFAPRIHRPIVLTEQEKREFGADISFVGCYEADRARKILELARRGFNIRIWGPGWQRCRLAHPRLQIEYRPVWGTQYVKVINATQINLCFLRKANRDLHTTRSFEIPACGAFMLGQRTEEHLRLFREGEEAEFFDSPDELEDKCRYYLEHEEERRSIGQAGRIRCLADSYSNHDRVKEVLDYLIEVNRKENG